MNRILNTPLDNSFYVDFINSKSPTDRFLPPLNKIDWVNICKSLKSVDNRYAEVKQILARQNDDLKSEKAIKYIADLADPDSIILITGQQLGLFASPVYTIYKLITTIKLAEMLNRKNYSYKFVPVFWLETEDHDFQEINTVGIMDKQFNPVKIVYNGTDRGKVPLRYYKLEAQIDSFVAEVFANSLETEFTSDLTTKLKDYYQTEASWMAAVRNLLKDLFYDTGLLFFEPGADEIKNISVEFFKHLLSDNKKITQDFEKTSGQLVQLGYQNQVKNIPGKTFIHLEQEGQQRAHLYRAENEFRLKDSDEMLTTEAAENFINGHPEKISTSVISRPLLQSWLLPVAAYIGGPAEIAYWAQIGELFTCFDLTLPVVYPRISATLVEPKIERYIKKYSVDIENIPLRQNTFLENFFKIQVREKNEDPIKYIRNSLKEGETRFSDYLNSIDSTLIDSGKKTVERMQQVLDNFENRVIKAIEEKDGRLTGHLEQIHSAFFPEGIPQERYLSIIYFLNKFGPQFVDHLMSDFELDNFNHQVISI